MKNRREKPPRSLRALRASAVIQAPETAHASPPRRHRRYIGCRRCNAPVTPAHYPQDSDFRRINSNGRNTMKRATRRHGFTLVEVLVILAILAALAAVLVPTVSNQVRKADLGRVTGDLTNLRTGVEAFLVNVHRYPADIEDLVFPIDGADADINGSGYPAGLQSRWEGPYIDRVIAAGDSLETGFGGLIADEFAITTDAGVDYLTVRIFGIALPEFTVLDANIDEGNGAAAGRLRFFASATTEPDSIHFFALPIN
jgi:prepilin-type N-terminal cleavage/methylation domain-containing protein